ATEEPERRVEVLRLRTELPPLVERKTDESPLLRERLARRGVERACVVLPECLDPHSGRQLRLRRRLAKLDRHLPEPPHLLVAARLEEGTGSLVGGNRPLPDPPKPVGLSAGLGKLHERGAQAAA